MRSSPAAYSTWDADVVAEHQTAGGRMMQEMMTIGVILASNWAPDGADTENPPAGILAPWRSKPNLWCSRGMEVGAARQAAGVRIHTRLPHPVKRWGRSRGRWPLVRIYREGSPAPRGNFKPIRPAGWRHVSSVSRPRPHRSLAVSGY